MVKTQYEVVWTKRSQQHINTDFKYISIDSPQNAVKVVEEIVTALNKAISNPEFYGRDKYKTYNYCSYRAFEKHHYRIVYRFTNNVIRVLRVRHTKMEPKQY